MIEIMKPIVVIPAAGRSSRFNGLSPKWMRTHPDGNLMIQKSLETFNNQDFDIYLITTAEIEEKFSVIEKLKLALPKVNVIILNNSTKSSVETLLLGLEKIGKLINIDTPLFVKDVDNLVEFDWKNFDMSTSSSVGLDVKLQIVNNIANKSFIVVNEDGLIIDFIEKEIVSNIISVGTHYFKSALEALTTAQLLLTKNVDQTHELYTSHLIAYNIYSGIEYKMIPAIKYEDFGTQIEWDKVRDSYKTIFVDFDGTLVENRGRYSNPNWFSRNDIPLGKNIDILKRLHANGSQIIITTSRLNSEKEYIREFLLKFEIKVHEIICDLNHSERILINDFFDTNKYPTATSINLPRNGDLSIYLK
jgi:hypothetical protein